MKKSMNSRIVERRAGEAGITLVEMLVSITIFLIVTGAIWGALSVARYSRTTVSEEVELSKTVRVGLNLIGRDTYNAGLGYPQRSAVQVPDNRLSALLGIPNDFDTTRDIVPPIIAGNNITPNTLNPVPGTLTDRVTFLYRDSTFNPVANVGTVLVSTPLSINAATTNVAGIDEIVPLAGTNAPCRVNDIYLITGSTGSTLGLATALSGTDRIQFANGDVLGVNQTGPAGPLRSITVPASLYRVLMVTYFVAPDGTLTRRRYANAPVQAPPVAFIDEPLVYGVEDFQIQYVMEDGAVRDFPSAGPDGVPGNGDDESAQLQAVRQIRFTVSVRSLERNTSGQPFRITMTSTYSTRNLGYEAN